MKHNSYDLAFKTLQNFSHLSRHKPVGQHAAGYRLGTGVPSNNIPAGVEGHTVIIAAKERISPCMGTSFALCKATGCAADFGAFSVNNGLWDPKINEETCNEEMWEMEQVHGHGRMEWV